MEPLRAASPPPRSPASEEAGGPRARLVGAVRPVAGLSEGERDQMYALLERHFLNTTRAGFAADLAEKSTALLISVPGGGPIVGFSTLARIDAELDGRAVRAFFSGDTIIDRAHWGSPVLPQVWARHVFGLAAEAGPAEVYWFLICSGYKTYRYMPLFFREFYPSYARPTPPALRRTLDQLAALKFPHEYCPSAGVVRLARPTPLRPEVAPLSEARRADPHIAFFAAANPGHGAGDELACLAPISVANLTPAGRRMLRAEA